MGGLRVIGHPLLVRGTRKGPHETIEKMVMGFSALLYQRSDVTNISNNVEIPVKKL